MLKGKYMFIRHEHNVGVSGPEKGNKPYDFASITLSDGVESFDADLDQSIIPSLAGLRKGDEINIQVEPQIKFKRTIYKVVNVSPAKVISPEKVS